MKQIEAKQIAIKLLSGAGILVCGDNLIIPENLSLPKALKIESEIEDIKFQNEDDVNCVFQIIDDKLVVCEA